MAEKTLNTRIINKHAALSAWSTSNLTLKTGEIALARVETTKPDGHGGYYTVPTYLMKVGDNNKKFSELEWLAAPASDVYQWAKKANMSASDMPVLTEDDAARIAPTFATAISNLQQAIGSGGSVNEMIQTAIAALDVTDTEVGNTTDAYQVVTAVSETDGKITVTRRALAIKDIAGLQAALDSKLAVATYNTDKAASDKLISDNAADIAKNAEDIAAVKATADAAAVKATVDAKFEEVDGAVEAAQADATAALNKIGDATKDGTLVKDVADLKANSATKTELGAAQTTLQGKIDEKAAQTDLDATNEAVEAAQGAADDAQADATAALNKIGDGYDATNTVAKDITAVKASVTKETEDREAADEGLDSRIQVLEGKIVDLSGAMHFKGVKTTIPTDYTDYVDGDVIIVGNKEYVYDSASDDKFVEFGDVDDVSGRVTTVEGKVLALETNSATKTELGAAQTTLQGKIDEKAAQTDLDATNEAVEAAQGTADDAKTKAEEALNKIGDATKDGTLVKDVADLKANSATKTELGAAQTTLQGKIDEKAAQTDLDATNEAVEAAEKAIEEAGKKITALEGVVGDANTAGSLVKEVNDLKTNSATKTELGAAQTTLQGKIDEKAAQTDLDATNEAVEAAQGAADDAQADATAALNKIGDGYDATNTVAKDITAVKARIAAIEEDYLTEADTYIFDCGGAV